MRSPLRALVTGNLVVLGLMITALFATPTQAQEPTGPSSSWGRCCKTYVKGGRFCCTDCCYTVKECISDSDPACKAKTEEEI